MSIRLTRGIAVALILLAPHPAGGQTRLDSLPRGARVRIHAPAAGVIWPAKAILDSHERGYDCFGEDLAWISLIGGVPVATGAGATVGFILPGGQWRRVALPER